MAGIIKPTWMVLFAVVLAVAPRSQAAISCGTVVSYLQPCIPYVVYNGPLGGCCGSITNLNAASKTPDDRRSVCNCLKSLAGQYSGPIVAKAAELPAKCGVNIPFKISSSTDCSKYV